MSESKKWMSLAAIGAAIAGVVARMRHRSDPPSPSAEPAATTAREAGPEDGGPTTPR